jgi:predicted component of type VI protein secretion system
MDFSSEVALNIHGIINLDQLSQLFQQLISQIDKQNKKILELEETISNCVSKSEFETHLSKVETTLNQVEIKVGKLQIASTSVIHDKK